MIRQSIQCAREYLQNRQAGEFGPGPNSVLVSIATDRRAAIKTNYRSRWLVFFISMLFLLLNGCVATATQQFATNLSTALVNQNDPALVRDGGPAHLLLLEGLLEGDPGNEGLLLAAARMYGAYASLFVRGRKPPFRRIHGTGRDDGSAGPPGSLSSRRDVG